MVSKIEVKTTSLQVVHSTSEIVSVLWSIGRREPSKPVGHTHKLGFETSSTLFNLHLFINIYIIKYRQLLLISLYEFAQVIQLVSVVSHIAHLYEQAWQSTPDKYEPSEHYVITFWSKIRIKKGIVYKKYIIIVLICIFKIVYNIRFLNF